MGAFFIYILKSAVCLVLFYLFFKLLLSRETFHRFNRVALLGVLLLSLLIPCIEVTTRHQVEVQQAMSVKGRIQVQATLSAVKEMAGWTIYAGVICMIFVLVVPYPKRKLLT